MKRKTANETYVNGIGIKKGNGWMKVIYNEQLIAWMEIVKEQNDDLF